MLFAVLTFALSLAAPAAPADAPPETEAPGIVEPPRRLDDAIVPYPAEALASRTEADILLLLTLDETGTVQDAEILRSAGEAFDAAVLDAIWGFRFSPAKLDGEPVAVQIEFVYSFRLAAEPDPAPEEALSEADEEPPPVYRSEVRGRSVAEERRRSAEAVKVVELRQAKTQSADLGQVLARQEGVEVRRSGGLGSGARFALNGLSDQQIRFFLDGVPLELSGYPFGISNVPVNLVERVEIFRGVVPVRYGADALGGAVELVSSEVREGAHGAASLQVGSYGLLRLSLGGSHRSDDLWARAHFFADHADNDYEVDGKLSDLGGDTSIRRVRRFHDGYDALGGGLELGAANLPFADRLTLRAFGSRYEKELQHDLVMERVYGEARYGGDSWGSQLAWKKGFGEAFDADVVVGWSLLRTDFRDVAEWIYNWHGKRENTSAAGEIGDDPYDQSIEQQAYYARAVATFSPARGHALRLSSAPTFSVRTGEDRVRAPDPLAGERTLFTHVLGLEYEVDLFDDTLELLLFGKDYRYAARARAIEGEKWRERDRELSRQGAGAALRLRLSEPLYAKASYERATRMPLPTEIFGDGVLVQPNLELTPESSHNLNLGLAGSDLAALFGVMRFEVSGFARISDSLIVLLGDSRFWMYQNVTDATALGVEAAVGWRSPERLLHLDANATFQDVRNTSTGGTFGKYEGDRIPYQPWLFANLSARLSLRDVLLDADEVSPYWSARYVHEFYRFWQSLGATATKDIVPSQLVHTAGVSWRMQRDGLSWGLNAELENVGDVEAYDFFGVPRPGRAASLKATIEY